MWRNDPPHLPEAKGPYLPGCMDIMLEYSITGTFTRLYYPTKMKTEQPSHSRWIPWFADDNYLDGIAKAIRVYPGAVRFVSWLYSAHNMQIPSIYGEKVNTDKKLKCIVFSHGFAGNRFLYSVICNELASRGYLVAVIEHRDQTACFTYYYKSKEDAALDIRTPVYVRKIQIGQGHYELRNEQVNQRANECSKLLDFLINLNNGIIPHNVLDDVKTGKEINFKLEDLVGHLDLDNLMIAGHSFGAASALLTLSKRKELKLGILLDPWMFPIKSENGILENTTQPLLFVNTQTFHIGSNVTAMEKFLTNEHRQMYTILHTTHENQTDSVLVLGYWLNWFMKKLNPYVALQINNGLILRFLKQHTGHDENIDDCEAFLHEQDNNIESGLTKPWI
ncbi:hypothetical protein ILUMI_23108 [Ignelater luminosus]|uniref:1-alkyl-2-acetylglycerophosphocholine esterase n=1 Tax=Ignelater luminosus TaxID=2038154 RepID=A0A8K0FZX0_IGNLU|nr:hypothetical protein ILUMI_23108 [Ignelater luminosus]